MRVLASKLPPNSEYAGPQAGPNWAPLHTQFVAGGAQVGRVGIPARNWISKSSIWCQQLTRGVCNNIADILVKVRGSGVKVRFWAPLLAGKSSILCEEAIAFENLSCCCPPRPNPSIPDHKTRQGMPWEHTEKCLTLRWWPESLFPGFPEMHHFCPANRPTH